MHGKDFHFEQLLPTDTSTRSCRCWKSKQLLIKRISFWNSTLSTLIISHLRFLLNYAFHLDYKARKYGFQVCWILIIKLAWVINTDCGGHTKQMLVFFSFQRLCCNQHYTVFFTMAIWAPFPIVMNTSFFAFTLCVQINSATKVLALALQSTTHESSTHWLFHHTYGKERWLVRVDFLEAECTANCTSHDLPYLWTFLQIWRCFASFTSCDICTVAEVS